MHRDVLIKLLILEGVLSSEKVITAFKKVRREQFVPERLKEAAYEDTPLPLLGGQTISAPHMVAKMTEELDVKSGQNILEIGTGSGYQAAILSVLNQKGKIFTIELSPELAECAKNALREFENVRVFSGDGSLGLPEYAPYDRIIATAGCPDIPKPWIQQIKDGGKIVAPVGGVYEQRLVLVEKRKGKIIEKDLNFPCVFVSLRGVYGQK
jgi:protein-L-isoaspartate(D-aspartate) O-methyltransferase